MAAWIVGALESAVVVGGVSALGAGLVGLGIPKDSVVQYERALKTDKYLLMVHGSAEQVEQARAIIERSPADKVALHSGELTGAGATA